MQTRLGYSALAAVVLAVWGQSASALNISFDYSYDSSGFFADAARRSTLQQAGNYLGSRLSDNLSAITSSGGNQFTASFGNPSTVAGASIASYSVAANTLVIFVGAQNLGSSLGQGGPGGYASSGTQAFIDTVDARGQLGALSAVPTDFGPWGGSISFNNVGTNWYFDSDVNTVETFTGFDFFSVAVHELGHVLGAGTADSWLSYVSGANFVGLNAMAAYGGPVPLNIDLAQKIDNAHWADAVTSTVNGLPQGAAMTSAIGAGTRKYFTDLDFAGAKDIGWQVTAVPVPAAFWLLVSGVMGLVAVSRRK